MAYSFRFYGEEFTMIGCGHFLVESRSVPGEHHSIDVQEMTCSCKGYQCTKYCRHLEKVKVLIDCLKELKDDPASSQADTERGVV